MGRPVGAIGVRLVRDLPLVCPGGDKVGETFAGAAVHCRIEKHNIASATDPTSLSRFCCAEYTACPTWQAEQERIHAQRREELIETGV